MCDETAKVSAHDAMPCGACSGIELHIHAKREVEMLALELAAFDWLCIDGFADRCLCG